MTVKLQDETVTFNDNPFETLRKILNTFSLNDPDLDYPERFPPIAAGLFGYLSYDLKDFLEKLPRTSIDNLRLPHIFFVAPSVIVVHDKIDDITRLCIPKRVVSGKSCLDDDRWVFQQILDAKPPPERDFRGDSEGFKSNFTRPNYMNAVEKIIEYIAAGDVYQVNIFDMCFEGDTFTLFKSLYHNNPAPFFAYIHAGDHQIVSTSPERFLLRTGEKIKGLGLEGKHRMKTKNSLRNSGRAKKMTPSSR
ncbi:MAG: chorismate-binding protein [Deltaproteobacteria bacterium]|nr:chorismate-binding protein [Deltaproteobacteria bacterium]